jgi:hypothetical protein
MWMPDAGAEVGLGSALRVPVAMTGLCNQTPPKPAIVQSHCIMQNESDSLVTGHAQVFTFLSLPGELRNRIYDFCAEEGAVNLPASQSRFGNLRYVCQLFYTEFSPVYLARTAVLIQPADIQRYLAVFYPGLRSHEPNMLDTPTGLSRVSNLPGRIRIDVPLGTTIDLNSFADLRPNKLQFTLVRGNFTNIPLQEASNLLQTILDSSCSTPFRQVIDRALFRYSFTPEVVFKLRRGITVTIPDQTSPYTHIFQHPSWLVQQGLPILHSLTIVVETFEGVLRAPGRSETRHRHSRGLMQLHPLDELHGSDSQEVLLAAQLAAFNLSQPRSKLEFLSNPSTQ